MSTWGRNSTSEPRWMFAFMDIRHMTKEELRDHMVRVTHEIGLPDGRYRYDATQITWKQAFKLARLNGMENVEHDCNKCIVQVAEWMMK